MYWPLLDRSKIDPTIFERSFGRVNGLARLLVLEKLPNNSDRDAYQDQRRTERGRPRINRLKFRKGKLTGNIKDQHDDEVPEWLDGEDDVSNYHTFTVPYGPKFHARKIERLLYAKDLLLNAEWNRPKDRDSHLHRHPAFFGSCSDVLGDCCGYCPQPSTPEDQELAEKESKIFVSGEICFLKDDPGRQAIGSFHPLTDDDWTEMAYVGNTARLCQAIVDHDLEHVQDWLQQDGADPNARDYTGRTPLQLAVTCSTTEIVQCLIDHEARLVARLVDGKTALHLAALSGKTEMIRSILRKSEHNEEVETGKQTSKNAERGDSTSTREAEKADENQEALDDEDYDRMDESETERGAATDASYVRVDKDGKTEQAGIPEEPSKDEPDVVDVDVLAWDTPVSSLHLAILGGHLETVQVLVQDFGANPSLPVKLVPEYGGPPAAILPLMLALSSPPDTRHEMIKMLVSLGASAAQADVTHVTALHYFAAHDGELLKTLMEADNTGTRRAINHLAVTKVMAQPFLQDPLTTALRLREQSSVKVLLSNGATPEISLSSFTEPFIQANDYPLSLIHISEPTRPY